MVGCWKGAVKCLIGRKSCICCWQNGLRVWNCWKPCEINLSTCRICWNSKPNQILNSSLSLPRYCYHDPKANNNTMTNVHDEYTSLLRSTSGSDGHGDPRGDLWPPALIPAETPPRRYGCRWPFIMAAGFFKTHRTQEDSNPRKSIYYKR